MRSPTPHGVSGTPQRVGAPLRAEWMRSVALDAIEAIVCSQSEALTSLAEVQRMLRLVEPTDAPNVTHGNSVLGEDGSAVVREGHADAVMKHTRDVKDNDAVSSVTPDIDRQFASVNMKYRKVDARGVRRALLINTVWDQALGEDRKDVGVLRVEHHMISATTPANAVRGCIHIQSQQSLL